MSNKIGKHIISITPPAEKGYATLYIVEIKDDGTNTVYRADMVEENLKIIQLENQLLFLLQLGGLDELLIENISEILAEYKDAIIDYEKYQISWDTDE